MTKEKSPQKNSLVNGFFTPKVRYASRIAGLSSLVATTFGGIVGCTTLGQYSNGNSNECAEISGKLVRADKNVEKLEGYEFSPSTGVYLNESPSATTLDCVVRYEDLNSGRICSFNGSLTDSVNLTHRFQREGYLLTSDGSWKHDLGTQIPDDAINETAVVYAGGRDAGNVIPGKRDEGEAISEPASLPEATKLPETNKPSLHELAATSWSYSHFGPFVISSNNREEYAGLVPERSELSWLDTISLGRSWRNLGRLGGPWAECTVYSNGQWFPNWRGENIKRTLAGIPQKIILFGLAAALGGGGGSGKSAPADSGTRTTTTYHHRNDNPEKPVTPEEPVNEVYGDWGTGNPVAQ